MMKARLLSILVIFASLFCACGRQHTVAEKQGDTLRLKYAENILIVRYADRTEVTMKDPWNRGRVLHRYLLLSTGETGADAKALRRTPSADATIVHVPLRRSVVFNTAHAWLLGQLGATDAIAGVADLEYMQLPELHRRVGQGRVANCGSSMSPDIERLIATAPDAILLSPFENSGGYGRLEELGTPLIECADYMETSALGRAEWMRFYGLLYGRQATADSLFAVVERNYLSLSRRAKAAKPRRSILTEKLTGNTWYVAGGKSSVGQLIADAGGSYAWSADNHSGSLALPFETVLDRAGDADVWVFNDLSPQLTYQRLLSEYHGYGQLRAFREHNVWYVNSLQVPYFEQVSFRPDWLLRDYVILLHPELKDLGTPRYYRTVERHI